MSEIQKKQAKTRDEKGRWLPGVPANPSGRPKGVKHKLSQSFLTDLAIHWQNEGGDILKRVTEDDPATVLRVIASLVPRELALKLEAGDMALGGVTINLVPLENEIKDIESPVIDEE